MNKGAFEKNAMLCLTFIHDLSNRKLGVCVATTDYLAKAMNRGRRQVTRYIKYLNDNGMIEKETSKPKFDHTKNRFYQKRKIVVTVAKPANSDQIMSIYFDKNIEKDIKSNLINDLVFNVKPVEYIIENYVTETTTLATKNAITGNINPDLPTIEEQVPAGFNFLGLIDMSRRLEYANEVEEAYKIVAETEAERAEEAFMDDLEDKAVEALKNEVDDPEIPLVGKTNFEKLVNYVIASHKKASTEMDTCFSMEDRLDSARILATQGFEENGKYFLSLYLGGFIEYKMPLFNYVTWDENSKEFEVFKQSIKRE